MSPSPLSSRARSGIDQSMTALAALDLISVAFSVEAMLTVSEYTRNLAFSWPAHSGSVTICASIDCIERTVPSRHSSLRSVRVQLPGRVWETILASPVSSATNRALVASSSSSGLMMWTS